MLHQSHATFFSYVMVIQNHPPTPVRNSNYLVIPPTPLPLRNIKMAPNGKSKENRHIKRVNAFLHGFMQSTIAILYAMGFK
jgi:hypothetical protein